jgi:hypothetical protein
MSDTKTKETSNKKSNTTNAAVSNNAIEAHLKHVFFGAAIISLIIAAS